MNWLGAIPCRYVGERPYAGLRPAQIVMRRAQGKGQLLWPPGTPIGYKVRTYPIWLPSDKCILNPSTYCRRHYLTLMTAEVKCGLASIRSKCGTDRLFFACRRLRIHAWQRIRNCGRRLQHFWSTLPCYWTKRWRGMFRQRNRLPSIKTGNLQNRLALLKVGMLPCIARKLTHSKIVVDY